MTERPMMERDTSLAGILFDAGGTLVVLDDGYVNELLVENGAVSVSADEQLRAHYQAMYEFSEVRRTGADAAWHWWVDRYFGLLGATDVEAIAQRFNGGRGKWNRALEGTHASLGALADAGYRLGVVSNSDGTVMQSLTDAGLADRFEFILDSHDVGVSKPDPRIFEAAAERMGVGLELLLYIGDSPFHDVEGGLAAGCGEALLVDPFGLAGDEFPSVSSVSELPRWFGVAEAG